MSDQKQASYTMHHENITTIDQSQIKGSPPAPTAEADQNEESKTKDSAEVEPKLFVDVNVANFGLQRIVVYEGDTVESLVEDFVKRCPIDEFMKEKLKALLQQQMDGVLERIEEDEDIEQDDEEDEDS